MVFDESLLVTDDVTLLNDLWRRVAPRLVVPENEPTAGAGARSDAGLLVPAAVCILILFYRSAAG